MPPRIRLALTVAVTCAAMMVVIVILAAGQGTGNAGGAPLVKTGRFYGATLPADFPAVDFALPDQDHHLIRLSDYAGQVVVATFVYSTCQNVCPIIVQEIAAAIAELPRRVTALAISVDPKQDTAANVQAFLVKEQVARSIHYLVAPRSVLAPIWAHFGVAPQRIVNSPKSDHSVDLLIFDKSGRPRVGYTDLNTLDPDVIAADIRTLQAQPPAASPPRRVQL